MDEETKAHVRSIFYLGLAGMGFSTAKWFNSAEPQRQYYKFYVLLLILAQFFGSRRGQRLFEESKRLQ